MNAFLYLKIAIHTRSPPVYSLRIYDKKVTLNGIIKDEAGYGGKPRNIGGFGGFDRDKRKSFDSDSENRAVKTFLMRFYKRKGG